MIVLDSFFGRSRTNKTNGGCLAPSSQTVGLLRRIPQLPKPSEKWIRLSPNSMNHFITFLICNSVNGCWDTNIFLNYQKLKKLREITLSLLCLHLFSLPLSPTPSLSLTFPVPFSQPISFSPFVSFSFSSLSLSLSLSLSRVQN
jgi:hypothetical protein